MYKQINVSMKNKLSKYTIGFKKLHETQDSTVTMLEKWKKVTDKIEFIYLNLIYESIKSL